MKPGALLLLTTAVAATLGLAMPAQSTTANSLPAEQAQGSVAYLSGGVGIDEAQAIERIAKSYPLTMEFLVKAQPRAAFTAQVKVVVKDNTGKVVLDTTSEGPFLLVRVPSGEYTVSAEQNGATKVRHVRVVDERPRRIIFEWNAQDCAGVHCTTG